MPKQIKDPASGFSHLFGAIVSVIGLVVLLRTAVANDDVWEIVSFSVFGASMILLYSASAIYHLLNVSEHAQTVLRTIDHIMIFVLIAGTYTPICLVPLRGPTGYTLLAIVWAIAIAGVFFKVFHLNAPRWLSTLIYLLMGWIVVPVIMPLARVVDWSTLRWLFMGGVFYSVGAVIYALKKPNLIPGWLGFHELFHIFILLGSMCHFYLIYLLA